MTSTRTPRLLGQKQNKFLLTVCLCALTAALIFLPFYLLDGGFFHYAGDFNSQQISFYRYMNGFFKGAGYPDSAFTSVRNTFSWATDLGSGVMNAYSFYLYGSPFFWFSLLFPRQWLPYLMVPLLVLKFGVAGGGAFLYLRRYVKNENYAVLGACLYALSGFAVYNVFFNHFVDVVALFPYLLWALDEAIYENRHGLFAFWVAVNLLNNYFFFVGQVIFLCIYFVCKLTAKDFRLTGRKFGHLLWESVLGVAMGCLLLFPAVLSLLQSKVHFILNPDIQLTADTLSDLADWMAAHPGVVMTRPGLTFPDGKPPQLPQRRCNVRAMVYRQLPCLRFWAKCNDRYLMADKDLTKPTEIEFCTGSFSAVDTAAFKAVGGFDEGYFMYVEDADLTQKMRTRGKAYLVPQYTAIHAWHRAAHRSLKPFLWQLRSLLRYFSKWGFAW